MPKYEVKHDIVKNLPKDFQEIADSGIDHLGSMLDNMKLVDILESGGLMFCAYIGYKAIGPTGLGLGILGYKLATTPSGGIISVSQVAGLGIMAALGIIPSINEQTRLVQEHIKEIEEESKKTGIPFYDLLPKYGIQVSPSAVY